jgi:tryptophan 2,3-dioxygenase
VHNEELHKITVSWDVMLCNLTDKYTFFKEMLPPSSGQKSQLKREMWHVM